MSTPQPLFTVTLTADELAHLVTAYRFMRHESEMPSAFDALNAAKPVRATKPRATPAAAEPFSPNTGNAAVDAFMRRKHDPKYKPLPLPKGEPWPKGQGRGGDRRPLRLVIAEHAADCARFGWPGTINVTGTRIEAAS